MYRKKLALFIAMAMVVIPVLSGCLGSGNKAKEQVEKGDGLYESALEVEDRLESTRAEIIKLMVSGDTEGLLEKEKGLVELASVLYETGLIFNDASSSYEKATGNQQDKEYKEYANMMMEAIASWKKSLESAREFVGELNGLIDDIKAGERVDLAAALTSLTPVLNRVDSYRDQAMGTEREAERYYYQHHLYR